ncbi:MAG: glutaredoxin family protein [Desulfobacterales bacterium]
MITLYALQTCSHCKETKKLLQERCIAFKTIYVDMLVGEERNDTMRFLKRINPSVSFPTLVVEDETIVGFQPKKIEAALEALSDRPED